MILCLAKTPERLTRQFSSGVVLYTFLLLYATKTLRKIFKRVTCTQASKWGVFVEHYKLKLSVPE